MDCASDRSGEHGGIIAFGVGVHRSGDRSRWMGVGLSSDRLVGLVVMGVSNRRPRATASVCLHTPARTPRGGASIVSGAVRPTGAARFTESVS